MSRYRTWCKATNVRCARWPATAHTSTCCIIASTHASVCTLHQHVMINAYAMLYRIITGAPLQAGLAGEAALSPRQWSAPATFQREVKLAALPPLVHVMRGDGCSPEVQVMACWAVGMLTYNDNFVVQHILREGMLDTWITWLQQDSGASDKLRQAAALAVGNFSYNN